MESRVKFQEKADEAGLVIFILSKDFAKSKTSKQQVYNHFFKLKRHIFGNIFCKMIIQIPAILCDLFCRLGCLVWVFRTRSPICGAILKKLSVGGNLPSCNLEAPQKNFFQFF